MDELQIREVVKKLDTTDPRAQETAWEQLRPLGVAVVPFLAEFYPFAKKAQGRVALVFHALRFARLSEPAFSLGVLALNDKATLVRYRACALCAYSLRRDAIQYLKALLIHADIRTVDDAKAAIDAIRHNNHHYFVDRDHTGRTFWQVNPDDAVSKPKWKFWP